jgi:hypothetical protein
MKGEDPVEQSPEAQFTGQSPEAIFAAATQPPPQPGQPGGPGMQLDSWKYFQNRS